MNKHHPHYLDRSLWDRSVNPNFANLRYHLGYTTIGSEKNPSRFVIPSELETMRILKENQAITISKKRKFLESEIKISKKLGLDSSSQVEYLNHTCKGVE